MTKTFIQVLKLLHNTNPAKASTLLFCSSLLKDLQVLTRLSQGKMLILFLLITYRRKEFCLFLYDMQNFRLQQNLKGFHSQEGDNCNQLVYRTVVDVIHQADYPISKTVHPGNDTLAGPGLYSSSYIAILRIIHPIIQHINLSHMQNYIFIRIDISGLGIACIRLLCLINPSSQTQSLKNSCQAKSRLDIFLSRFCHIRIALSEDLALAGLGQYTQECLIQFYTHQEGACQAFALSQITTNAKHQFSPIEI